MKILKKIISLILTAAVMLSMVCVGTVSASAAESDLPYVEMYENSYYKTLGYTFWLQGKQKEIWNNNDSYIKKCSHGNYYGLLYALILEDGTNTYELFYMRSYSEGRIGFVENGKSILPYDAGISIAGTELGWDYGFAFCIYTGSSYYEKFKKCTKVSTYNCMVYDSICPNEDTCGKVFCADGTKSTNEIAYTEIELHNLNVKLDSVQTSQKNISSLNISIGEKYSYTGKNIKAKVTVKDGSKTLVKGTDYTLTYKNCKNIGTASVTIKGKGNYTGTKTLTYKIVPKKTTLKATKKSNTKASLSWTAVKGAEKYQIYYSTDGKTYKKLATVSGSKTSVTISKLDFQKYDYKFKIRSYNTNNSTKYYSSFSKTVTIK